MHDIRSLFPAFAMTGTLIKSNHVQFRNQKHLLLLGTTDGLTAQHLLVATGYRQITVCLKQMTFLLITFLASPHYGQ